MSGCATCGKQASLKKCSRCQSVAYCSTDCQKSHWKQHKPSCTPAQSNTAASAKLEAERMRRELIEKLHLAENESHGHHHNAHSHSHGGKPCGGHGGPSATGQAKMKAKQEQHGHAHADHSHSNNQHGHSHNGQPCHGHGSTDAHAHAEQNHSHAEHGHSHNGQPCHGHGSAAHAHAGHDLKIYTNPKLVAAESVPANISINGAQPIDDKPAVQLEYNSTESDRPVINGHHLPQSVTFIPLSTEQTLDPENKNTDLRSSFCPTCAMSNTGFLTAASDEEREFLEQLKEHVEVARGTEADYKAEQLVSFIEGAETNDISEYPDCIAELNISTAELPVQFGDQSATTKMTIVQLMVQASQPPPVDPEASKKFFSATSTVGRTFTRRFEFVAESAQLDTPVKMPHIALDYALAAVRREIEGSNPEPLFTFPAHLNLVTDRCEWMGQQSLVDPSSPEQPPVNERLLFAERMQINMALRSMWKAWNIKEFEVAVLPPGHARVMLLKWEEQTEPVQRFFVKL